MRFCVLGSGSKGNSTFIEGGGTRILIDAGFSGIELERRLASIAVDIATVSAILVTHEHGDHISGVQVLARRFGVPVFISRAAKVEAGSSSKDVKFAQEDCVVAVVEDLIARKIIPTIKVRAK